MRTSFHPVGSMPPHTHIPVWPQAKRENAREYEANNIMTPVSKAKLAQLKRKVESQQAWISGAPQRSPSNSNLGGSPNAVTGGAAQFSSPISPANHYQYPGAHLSTPMHPHSLQIDSPQRMASLSPQPASANPYNVSPTYARRAHSPLPAATAQHAYGSVPAVPRNPWFNPPPIASHSAHLNDSTFLAPTSTTNEFYSSQPRGNALNSSLNSSNILSSSFTSWTGNHNNSYLAEEKQSSDFPLSASTRNPRPASLSAAVNNNGSMHQHHARPNASPSSSASTSASAPSFFSVNQRGPEIPLWEGMEHEVHKGESVGLRSLKVAAAMRNAASLAPSRSKVPLMSPSRGGSSETNSPFSSNTMSARERAFALRNSVATSNSHLNTSANSGFTPHVPVTSTVTSSQPFIRSRAPEPIASPTAAAAAGEHASQAPHPASAHMTTALPPQITRFISPPPTVNQNVHAARSPSHAHYQPQTSPMYHQQHPQAVAAQQQLNLQLYPQFQPSQQPPPLVPAYYQGPVPSSSPPPMPASYLPQQFAPLQQQPQQQQPLQQQQQPVAPSPAAIAAYHQQIQYQAPPQPYVSEAPRAGLHPRVYTRPESSTTTNTRLAGVVSSPPNVGGATAGATSMSVVNSRRQSGELNATSWFRPQDAASIPSTHRDEMPMILRNNSTHAPPAEESRPASNSAANETANGDMLAAPAQNAAMYEASLPHSTHMSVTHSGLLSGVQSGTHTPPILISNLNPQPISGAAASISNSSGAIQTTVAGVEIPTADLMSSLPNSSRRAHNSSHGSSSCGSGDSSALNTARALQFVQSQNVSSQGGSIGGSIPSTPSNQGVSTAGQPPTDSATAVPIFLNLIETKLRSGLITPSPSNAARSQASATDSALLLAKFHRLRLDVEEVFSGMDSLQKQSNSATPHALPLSAMSPLRRAAAKAFLPPHHLITKSPEAITLIRSLHENVTKSSHEFLQELGRDNGNYYPVEEDLKNAMRRMHSVLTPHLRYNAGSRVTALSLNSGSTTEESLAVLQQLVALVSKSALHSLSTPSTPTPKSETPTSKSLKGSIFASPVNKTTTIAPFSSAVEKSPQPDHATSNVNGSIDHQITAASSPPPTVTVVPTVVRKVSDPTPLHTIAEVHHESKDEAQRSPYPKEIPNAEAGTPTDRASRTPSVIQVNQSGAAESIDSTAAQKPEVERQVSAGRPPAMERQPTVTMERQVAFERQATLQGKPEPESLPQSLPHHALPQQDAAPQQATVTTVNEQQPVSAAVDAAGATAGEPQGEDEEPFDFSCIEAIARWSFAAQAVGQLSIVAGEALTVRSDRTLGWILVENRAGMQGHVPENYCSYRLKDDASMSPRFISTEDAGDNTNTTATAGNQATKQGPAADNSPNNTVATTEPAASTSDVAPAAATTLAAPATPKSSRTSPNFRTSTPIPFPPIIEAIGFYPFTAEATGQLSFEAGEILLVKSGSTGGWLVVENERGERGYIPEVYCKYRVKAGIKTVNENGVETTTKEQPWTTPKSAKMQPTPEEMKAAKPSGMLSSASPAPVARVAVKSPPGSPQAVVKGHPAVALFAFTAQVPTQLSFEAEEELLVTGGNLRGWVTIQNAAGQKGHAPENYMEFDRNQPVVTAAERFSKPAASNAVADDVVATASAAAVAAEVPQEEKKEPQPAAEEPAAKSAEPISAAASSEANSSPASNSTEASGAIAAKGTPSEVAPLEQSLPAVALYNFAAPSKGQLALKAGDRLSIKSKALMGWILAENEKGEKGHVPESYVKLLPEEAKVEPAAVKEEKASPEAKEAEPAAAVAKVTDPASAAPALVAAAAASATTSPATSTPSPTATTPTAAFESDAVAVYAFAAPAIGQLALKAGEDLMVSGKLIMGWIQVTNAQGKKGNVPANYIKISEKKAAAPVALDTKESSSGPLPIAVPPSPTASSAAATEKPAAAVVEPSARVEQKVEESTGGRSMDEILAGLAAAAKPTEAAAKPQQEETKTSLLFGSNSKSTAPVEPTNIPSFDQPTSLFSSPSAVTTSQSPSIRPSAAGRTPSLTAQSIPEEEGDEDAPVQEEVKKKTVGVDGQEHKASNSAAPTATEQFPNALPLLTLPDSAYSSAARESETKVAPAASASTSASSTASSHTLEAPGSPNLAYAYKQLSDAELKARAQEIGFDIKTPRPAASETENSEDGIPAVPLSPVEFTPSKLVQSVIVQRSVPRYAPLPLFPFLQSRYDLRDEIGLHLLSILEFLAALEEGGVEAERETLAAIEALIEFSGFSSLKTELEERLDAYTREHFASHRKCIDAARAEPDHEILEAFQMERGAAELDRYAVEYQALLKKEAQFHDNDEVLHRVMNIQRQRSLSSDPATAAAMAVAANAAAALPARQASPSTEGGEEAEEESSVVMRDTGADPTASPKANSVPTTATASTDEHKVSPTRQAHMLSRPGAVVPAGFSYMNSLTNLAADVAAEAQEDAAAASTATDESKSSAAPELVHANLMRPKSPPARKNSTSKPKFVAGSPQSSILRKESSPPTMSLGDPLSRKTVSWAPDESLAAVTREEEVEQRYAHSPREDGSVPLAAEHADVKDSVAERKASGEVNEEDELAEQLRMPLRLSPTGALVSFPQGVAPWK